MQSDHYNDHVARQMTATEIKARLLAVLDEVAAGDEVEITKHGRTVARLVPARGAGRALRGRMAGVASTIGGDDGVFSTGLSWELDDAGPR